VTATTGGRRRGLGGNAIPGPSRHQLAACLARAETTLRIWLRRYRYRRDLERILQSAPHLVEDIGLMRIHAKREARKPFWRA
jgi:uncharacterized protein YjiS (DUF1127 family)